MEHASHTSPMARHCCSSCQTQKIQAQMKTKPRLTVMKVESKAMLFLFLSVI